MTASRAARPFTGRHMLLIMVCFFGVIIAVNLLMATFASTSWTGLVVQNTYVASQQFNRKAEEGRAQAALGWKSELTLGTDLVRFALVDASGAPVEPSAVRAVFRHPAYETQDMAIALSARPGGVFEARQTVPDGVWIVDIDADVGRERPYRDVRRIVVSNGAIR